MALTEAVDNLYLYDPQFEAGANKFLSEVGGSSAARAVSCWDDLDAALNAFTLVKFLVFDTHGRPGRVCLANGTKLEGVDFMILKKNPHFLKMGARILFYGCNIGEGKQGDDFMDEIGLYVLRGKGGIVGTSTVSNISLQLGPFASETFMDPTSFGARLKVRRYDLSGALVSSRTTDRYGAVTP